MLGYQTSYSAFLIPFLNEEKEVSYAAAGALLGISQLVGAFSRPFLGWLSDKMFHGSRKRVLLICGFGNVIFSLGLVYLTGSYMSITILLLLLLGITCFGWGGIYFAYIVEIFGYKRSGIGTGYGLMANCIGAALGPLIFGLLLDITSSYKFAFTVNSIFVLAVSFIIFHNLSESRVINNTTKITG